MVYVDAGSFAAYSTSDSLLRIFTISVQNDVKPLKTIQLAFIPYSVQSLTIANSLLTYSNGSQLVVSDLENQSPVMKTLPSRAVSVVCNSEYVGVMVGDSLLLYTMQSIS